MAVAGCVNGWHFLLAMSIAGLSLSSFCAWLTSIASTFSDAEQVESTSNGVEEELLCFARLASGAIQQSKKAAVGTASGGAAELALEHGGKAELPELPSEEDEYRVR
jgi:hypothetical protein